MKLGRNVLIWAHGSTPPPFAPQVVEQPHRHNVSLPRGMALQVLAPQCLDFCQTLLERA